MNVCYFLLKIANNGKFKQSIPAFKIERELKKSTKLIQNIKKN